MNKADFDAIVLEGGVLSPTLAAELVKSSDTLTPQVREQLGRLIARAGEADREFGRASQEYRACIQQIEDRALRRVLDEEQRIMEEFERELLTGADRGR